MNTDSRFARASAHPTLRVNDLAARKGTNAHRPWDQTAIYFTYNGRGAIYQILRSLPAEKGDCVLLPAFHCSSVVEAVVGAGYRAAFYRIRRDLSVDFEDLRRKLSSDVAGVLVINYCGFPADIGPLLELRETYGFYVLDDWAHSFLAGQSGRLTGDRADLSIYSFYKLVPSYVGGGLRINTPALAFRPPAGSIGFKQSLVAVKALIEQVVDNSEDGVFKSAFQYAERKRVALKHRGETAEVESAPPVAEAYVFCEDLAVAKMPWFARIILERSDLNEVVAARRRNYRIVDENLRETASIRKVFRCLPGDVCPWAYPVLLNDRSKYDHLLRTKGVPLFTFGESLHPLVYEVGDAALEDAVYLSTNLMLIAIHQNLAASQVLTFCQTINDFFGRMGAAQLSVSAK